MSSENPQDTKNLSPQDAIIAIQQSLMKILDEVAEFQGSKEDKKYTYLDELLIRNLIKLDNIEPGGDDEVKKARREGIQSINKCSNLLEIKAEYYGAYLAKIQKQRDEEREREELEKAREEVKVQQSTLHQSTVAVKDEINPGQSKDTKGQELPHSTQVQQNLTLWNVKEEASDNVEVFPERDVDAKVPEQSVPSQDSAASINTELGSSPLAQQQDNKMPFIIGLHGEPGINTPPETSQSTSPNDNTESYSEQGTNIDTLAKPELATSQDNTQITAELYGKQSVNPPAEQVTSPQNSASLNITRLNDNQDVSTSAELPHSVPPQDSTGPNKTETFSEQSTNTKSTESSHSVPPVLPESMTLLHSENIQKGEIENVSEKKYSSQVAETGETTATGGNIDKDNEGGTQHVDNVNIHEDATISEDGQNYQFDVEMKVLDAHKQGFDVIDNQGKSMFVDEQENQDEKMDTDEIQENTGTEGGNIAPQRTHVPDTNV